MQGSITTDATRATIIALILSAQFTTDSEIAKVARVSSSTVSRIKSAIPSHILKRVDEVKKDVITELVQENLTEMMLSNIRIAKVTEDEIWLKKQSAAELTTLLGVQADKAFRILIAIDAAEEARINGDTGYIEAEAIEVD